MSITYFCTLVHTSQKFQRHCGTLYHNSGRIVADLISWVWLSTLYRLSAASAPNHAVTDDICHQGANNCNNANGRITELILRQEDLSGMGLTCEGFSAGMEGGLGYKRQGMVLCQSTVSLFQGLVLM